MSIELAQKLNLEPVFETARMYKSSEPNIDNNKIFEITTVELG